MPFSNNQNSEISSSSFDTKNRLIQEKLNDASEIVELGDAFLGDALLPCVLEMLRKFPSKTSLSLRGNHLQTEGGIAIGKFLKENSSIKQLNVEWNNLGNLDCGVEEIGYGLEMNESLQVLDLRNNNIGPGGANMLAKGLRNNKSLMRLDLRWNAIGSIGGQAFADILENDNKCLVELELSGNNIPTHLVSEIAFAIQRNHDGANGIPSEDQLLLNYLSDSEQAKVDLDNASSRIDEMQEKLHEQQLKADTFEMKLEKQLELSARMQTKLAETQELLQISKRYQNESENQLSGRYKLVCHEKDKLLKESAQLKDAVTAAEVEMHKNLEVSTAKITMLEDQVRSKEGQYQKLQLSFSATTQELERCRSNLQDEREHWNEERTKIVERENSKNSIIQDRMKSTLEDTKRRLQISTEKASTLEQERRTLTEDNENLRASLLSIKLEEETVRTELEERLQAEMEERVSTSLSSLEKKLQQVQDARDIAQQNVNRHIKQIAILQQQHHSTISSYEGTIENEKEMSHLLRQQYQAKEEEWTKLSAKLVSSEAKYDQVCRSSEALQQKYENLQEIHSAHLEKVNASYREDRVQWESEIEAKSSHNLELENTNQKMNAALRSLQQSQERRFNEFSSSIQRYIQDRLLDERQTIQAILK